ncbi:sulfatase-like hydrolase/transferase [Saccharomonospora azurea]|uniref:sulfatase-like hydrolase/transferase n=1 Tax=Saccharomonospora azurea TaxID=40988 RepID=UPI003D93D914
MIVVLADDLGWKNLGCYGSTAIRTPNLDRLAAEGLRFTPGYAGPMVFVHADQPLHRPLPGSAPGGSGGAAGSRSEGPGIPADHPTLPSLLAGAGYRTAMFGK